MEQGQNVRLEVPPEAVERARTLLSELPEVVSVAVREDVLEVNVRPTGVNELLGPLVEAGIEVRHFSYQKKTLETLFLSSTKGLGE